MPPGSTVAISVVGKVLIRPGADRPVPSVVTITVPRCFVSVVTWPHLWSRTKDGITSCSCHSLLPGYMVAADSQKRASMNPIRQVLNVLLPIRPISGKSPVRYRTTAQALSSAIRIARRRKAVDLAASFATESVIEEIENSSVPWDFLKDRSDDAAREPTPAMAKKTVGNSDEFAEWHRLPSR